MELSGQPSAVTAPQAGCNSVRCVLWEGWQVGCVGGEGEGAPPGSGCCPLRGKVPFLPGPISGKRLVCSCSLFFRSEFSFVESQRENTYSYNCLLYGVDLVTRKVSEKLHRAFPSSERAWEGAPSGPICHICHPGDSLAGSRGRAGPPRPGL